MAPHTGSATPEQIDTLLNFLDDHRDLARGRLRNVEGKVHARRLWTKICNKLNSMGSCRKTVQQWQKVWFDRKHLAKKAAAVYGRPGSATRGGQSMAPPFSHWELKVLSILEEGSCERQARTSMPAFSQVNEPIPSTSSQTTLPLRRSEPISVDFSDDDMEYKEPTASQSRRLTEPASHASQESRRFSQSTRLKRQSTVRSKLFQLEEGRADREIARNNELAGIRFALQQLCGLFKEYLDRLDLDRGN